VNSGEICLWVVVEPGIVRQRDDTSTWETLPLFRNEVWLTSDNKQESQTAKDRNRITEKY